MSPWPRTCLQSRLASGPQALAPSTRGSSCAWPSEGTANTIAVEKIAASRRVRETDTGTPRVAYFAGRDTHTLLSECVPPTGTHCRLAIKRFEPAYDACDHM